MACQAGGLAMKKVFPNNLLRLVKTTPSQRWGTRPGCVGDFGLLFFFFFPLLRLFGNPGRRCLEVLPTVFRRLKTRLGNLLSCLVRLKVNH